MKMTCHENQIPVLSGIGIVKTYHKKNRPLQALKGIDFSLYTGEILGIVGESGSGKSTLLKMISGLEKPDQGHLYYQGREYTGKGPGYTGRFLQMVFQDAEASFNPRMTMLRSLREVSNADRDGICRLLPEMGIGEELLSRKPGQLSGGQCQRMSLARALLAGAKVLLCDEITSALDVTTQAQVMKLLVSMKESQDLAIIFVSHDLALVSMVCDRIMVMKNGVCVEEGTSREICTKPQNLYTKELINSVMAL